MRYFRGDKFIQLVIQEAWTLLWRNLINLSVNGDRPLNCDGLGSLELFLPLPVETAETERENHG